MDTVEMYTPKFKVIDIFKALRKIKTDELLPEGGAFDFFYQNLQYPGISLFLRHRNTTKFFYVDHDDLILEIKDQTPEWDISIDKNLLRLSLIYKIHDASASINFVFDISKEEYRELLAVVCRKKEIKLYYMPMLYGGVVFDSYRKLKVPSKIIDVLKKMK